MSLCACVKKAATSAGQWRSSVCSTMGHYSYSAPFLPLRTGILVVPALCRVSARTFVPIQCRVGSAMSRWWLSWPQTKHIDVSRGATASSGRTHTAFSPKFSWTESFSHKDLATLRPANCVRASLLGSTCPSRMLCWVWERLRGEQNITSDQLLIISIEISLILKLFWSEILVCCQFMHIAVEIVLSSVISLNKMKEMQMV